MITKSQLSILYEWAKITKFPIKNAPTTSGYCNKPIGHYWLKSIAKTILIRKNLMSQDVVKICENEDILYAGYSVFMENTILKPHKDPNIYREEYKRIQIPLNIPDKEKCYMNYNNNRFSWEEGIPQVHYVMDIIHDGANLSNLPMDFLFVDVKKSVFIEI